jgi:hypothetical protein
MRFGLSQIKCDLTRYILSSDIRDFIHVRLTANFDFPFRMIGVV